MARLTDVPRRARQLRGMDPDSPEYIPALQRFFVDRDRYIEAFGSKGLDFVEISPMVPHYSWLSDPGEHAGQYLTKQERATIKGRRRDLVARDRARNKGTKGIDN